MLGELVKWKGDDGGWRTGRKVNCASNFYDGSLRLVQHSCTYELEWVPAEKLERWQPRSEWEPSDG